MNIGQAARESGISSKMIRHYEAIGLIAQPARSAGGYRTYSEKDLHILRFIKSARSLGFSLEQVKQLLSLWLDKERMSADVKVLALQHVSTLTRKIDELTAMRELLKNITEVCHGDDRPDCPIIEKISGV